MFPQPTPMPDRESIYSLTTGLGGGGHSMVWPSCCGSTRHARNSDRCCCNGCHVVRPPCRQSSARGPSRPARRNHNPCGVIGDDRSRHRGVNGDAHPTEGTFCLHRVVFATPRRRLLVFSGAASAPMWETRSAIRAGDKPDKSRERRRATRGIPSPARARHGTRAVPLVRQGRAA